MLEPFCIAVLTSQVNLSNTIKPLHIENFNVERAVKRVRRYAVEQIEEELEVSSGVCVVCGGKGYAKAIDGEGCRLLCRRHFDKVKTSLLGWKVLDE